MKGKHPWIQLYYNAHDHIKITPWERERDNHIASSRALSPDEGLLPTHYGRQQQRWRWLRGQFPIPAGCRNRNFCPPKLDLDGGIALSLFWIKCSRRLGFFWRGEYIVRKAAKGSGGGAQTPPGHGWPLGRARAPPGCCGRNFGRSPSPRWSTENFPRNFYYQNFLIWHRFRVGSGPSLKSIWWRQIQEIRVPPSGSFCVLVNFQIISTHQSVKQQHCAVLPLLVG